MSKRSLEGAVSKLLRLYPLKTNQASEGLRAESSTSANVTAQPPGRAATDWKAQIGLHLPLLPTLAQARVRTLWSQLTKAKAGGGDLGPAGSYVICEALQAIK